MRLDGEKMGPQYGGYCLVTNDIILKQMREKLTHDVGLLSASDIVKQM